MLLLFVPNRDSIASAPVVPFCTATILPSRSAALLISLFSGTKILFVERKYGTEKSYVCLRSSLIVIAEIPKSAISSSTSTNTGSQPTFTILISYPASLATASIKSTSNPTNSPLSKYSNGA